MVTRPEVTSEESGSLLVPADNPIETVRSLAPRIRELASFNEVAGDVSSEITDALREAGIYSLLAPTVLGGGTTNGEIHPSALIEVIETLTAADGSTGWSVMAQMTGIGSWLALLPDEGVEVILRSADYRTAGQIPLVGRAVAVQGGYRVTGNFGFASGSSSAGWFFGGFVIHDEEGSPVVDSDGSKKWVMAILPRNQTDLKGGWDVLGLGPTASIDYGFTDAYVPAYMTHNGTLRRGDTLHRGGIRVVDLHRSLGRLLGPDAS